MFCPSCIISLLDTSHRIGQQARVRCLYFIGRGTLDEVLWKLIEKKFRDLGEFVEGKENMDIALERELEHCEHEEILKSEDNADDGTSKKRKSQDVFGDLLDTDDLELKHEIDELCHEEEDMLNIKNENDEDEPDADENITVAPGENVAPAAKAAPSEVVELSDDEEVNVKPLTIAHIQNRYRESRILAHLRILPHAQFNNVRLHRVIYPGPQYGLIMVSCNGRVIVKQHQTDNSLLFPAKVGSIIVGVNGYLLP